MNFPQYQGRGLGQSLESWSSMVVESSRPHLRLLDFSAFSFVLPERRFVQNVRLALGSDQVLGLTQHLCNYLWNLKAFHFLKKPLSDDKGM